MSKTYEGTNPAVDHTNTATVPAGVTIAANIDFDGQARGIDEIAVQLDAIFDHAVAGTMTVEHKAQYANLMRQLGTVLQNTSIEGLRGKATGATPAAGSLSESLAVIFAL